MKLIQNTYHIYSSKIPEAFNGFKIVQISDLHNRKIDYNFLDDIDGNVVVLTGDILDGKSESALETINFINRIQAPVYYITGNHESFNIEIFRKIENAFENNNNVHILHDESVLLTQDNQSIQLIGLDDLKYLCITQNRDRKLPDLRLKDFNLNELYSIVLLHSPNNIKTISQYKPDLVLSGHTHGGQFRFPYFGALYAPGQGLFPKYDRGYYKINTTELIINSGIGFSRIPLRINCPAEINTIILHIK